MKNKDQQKKLIQEIMQDDEELGLYEEPKKSMTEKEILLEIMKKGNILSQSILAEVTGIKQQQINSYIKGHRKPKLSTLYEIAKAVDVDINICVLKTK